MIPGLRRMLRAPFARPPGRRSRLARFAPEWCLAGVVVTLGALWLLAHCRSRALHTMVDISRYAGLMRQPYAFVPSSFAVAVKMSSALAALAVIFAPVIGMACAWSEERRMGTLESLLLTPVHPSRYVRGRFWNILLPWVRFACYVLPIYFAASVFSRCAVSGQALATWSYGAAPWSIRWLDFLGKVFVAHSLDASVCVWRMETLPAASVHGFLLSGMRWANDASSFLFAAALAFFLSVRVKSVRKAVTLSLLAAAGALLTVLSPDAWWLALSTMLQSRNPDTYLHAYWLVTLALVAARIVLAFKLVSSVAERFNAYVLDERPARIG